MRFDFEKGSIFDKIVLLYTLSPLQILYSPSLTDLRPRKKIIINQSLTRLQENNERSTCINSSIQYQLLHHQRKSLDQVFIWFDTYLTLISGPSYSIRVMKQARKFSQKDKQERCALKQIFTFLYKEYSFSRPLKDQAGGKQGR